MSDAPGMLWGGRFAGGPHPDMMRLTASVDVDLALLPYDASVTKAHARALAAAGLLDDGVLPEIDTALDAIVAEWEAGTLTLFPEDEDVHSLVERELTRRLGETGRRIHAGRSRNDLVATDLRLWCRDAAADLITRLCDLIDALAARAEEHAATIMPGFTHLQPAQPVTVGFHLAAHGFALARDVHRAHAARTAADVSALGAGALAGTTLPLDPEIAAGRLGFGGIFDNAMDAVSDRDFASDLLYACATTAVHLSRLAEEIVLWTAPAFGFARLPDEWSTGSSMMPQKRNPDMAELVRGRAAGAIADLTGLLALLKGLPLAYDRDLQEDKGFVFRTAARTAGCIEGTTHMVTGLEFDAARLAQSAGEGGTWATDLAEALVGRGVPFRDAHEATGRVVAAVEAGGAPDAALLRAHHDRFEPGDVALIDPRASVAARAGSGGTAPERVREQAARLRALAAAARGRE